MNFNYSKHKLSPKESRYQRIFEIIPGLTSWVILAGMAYLSVTQPILAAVLIISFYLYWLFRLVYMTVFLLLSYLRLHIEQRIDWPQRVEHVDDLNRFLESKNSGYVPMNLFGRISHYIHRQELNNLKASGFLPPASRDIVHLVIYPVVKEEKEIVEPGIASLKSQSFSSERILFVFALEERASPKIHQQINELSQKYKQAFRDVLTVVHPSYLPGEAVVKGANVTYAAKKAAAYFAQNNIPAENVIVSCFDADTVVPPHYCMALTYYFMITPQRLQSSFQPVPVYHNNIWDVPGFARVIEAGSSFFQLIEATNPEKLVTFSSHSMSFHALVTSGYWPVDMISDDSAIYWKCLIHFNGNYRVVPMSITLSMDVAGSEHFWKTVRTVYKQKRRWAWGVENFPIVMRAFMKSTEIPFTQKVKLGFKLFEGHISWSTWGFLLSFIGWLPGLFAQQEYLTSVAYYNVPRISTAVFQLGAVSLICSIIISLLLLPKKERRFSLLKRLKHIGEWFFIPVILLIFSALPALDAQTRLMLGRHMEFGVTEKKRRKF